MENKGLGRDYDAVARMLPSTPVGESVRQIVMGYRRPSWDLCFELQKLTGIDARLLREMSRERMRTRRRRRAA